MLPYMLIVFFSLEAPALQVPFASEALCHTAKDQLIAAAYSRTSMIAKPTAVCVKVQ